MDAPGAGGVGGLAHCTALDAGDARRDADDDPGAGEGAATTQHLAHEVPQHLGSDLVVCDHAVAQRADRLDVTRGAPDHPLGFSADRDDRVRGRVDSYHRGLIEQDAPATGIDERVGSAEIDAEVVAEQVAAALADATLAGTAMGCP